MYKHSIVALVCGVCLAGGFVQGMESGQESGSASGAGESGEIIEGVQLSQIKAITALSVVDDKPEALLVDGTMRHGLTKNQFLALLEAGNRLNSLTSLAYYGSSLTEFPNEILQMTSLTKLHLSNNKIAILPEGIAQLTALLYLHLNANQLSTLPASIRKLKNLKGLSLEDNQFTDLPRELLELPAETRVGFRGNNALIEKGIIEPREYQIDELRGLLKQ
jgi:Leucine-rich repeat (LRR) protein